VFLLDHARMSALLHICIAECNVARDDDDDDDDDDFRDDDGDVYQFPVAVSREAASRTVGVVIQRAREQQQVSFVDS